MAASSLCREIGEYIMDTDDKNCLGQSCKVIVYPGKYKSDEKKTVAGKRYLWDKRYSADMVDNEIEIMKSIPPHENVLKLLHNDTVEIGNYKELWLILEHCKLGHLAEFAHSQHLSLAQKLDLMLQSARGVHHLHHMDKPVFHMDLKISSFLVTGTPGQPVVKVSDFSESMYFESPDEHYVRKIELRGTPAYLAPELCDDRNFRPEQNKAVDMFALGMSFQYLLEAEMDQIDQSPMRVTVDGKEILLGKHLYNNPDTDVARLLMKPGDSADVRDIKLLIAEMLARDIRKRLTIDKVLLRLGELRTRLGIQVHVALVALDTVWDNPVFYFDKDLMESIEAKIEKKQSSDAQSDQPANPHAVQEYRALPDPPERNAKLRLDHAERALTDTRDVLDQLSRLRVRFGQLLAVSVDEDDAGVWVHEGSEWERVSDVTSERADSVVCVCHVREGMIACGGLRGDEISRHCHQFSQLTRQWRRLSNMLTPRFGASAVEYDDQKVLVAGGANSRGELDVCEVLDCQLDNWTPSSDLPEALMKPLMAAAGAKVCILRQFDVLEQPKLVMYEPSNRSGKSTRTTSKYTSALPDDVRDTRGACLASAGQRLYLLGGGQGLALAYTPLTDQWEHLTPPSLRFDELSGCCAAVTAGHIVVFGGSSSAEEKGREAEVYDTRAGKWYTLDMRLPFPYNQHSKRVAQYDD